MFYKINLGATLQDESNKNDSSPVTALPNIIPMSSGNHSFETIPSVSTGYKSNYEKCMQQTYYK